MKCNVCNKIFDNFRKLSKHIRDNHKEFSIQKYYDTFVKKEKEGLCPICNAPTNFASISKGYHLICSSRKCACTFNRDKLRKNPEKFNLFKEKVSKNLKNMWKFKDNSLRVSKTTKTRNKWVETLSDDERSEIFGWLNKLSPEEKSIKCKELLDKTLFKWWKNASDEQKQQTYKKIVETKIKNGTCLPESEEYNYLNYKKQVRKLSEQNYKKYKEFINPNNLIRSRKMQLDHRVSIFNGFILGIPKEIIASPYNLELLDGYKNNQKHKNNSISIEELCQNFKKVYSSQQIQKNTKEKLR